MSKIIIGLAAAALLAGIGGGALSSGGASAATIPGAAAAAAVTLPFAPPLDTPIRFAYDHVSTVGDVQRQRLRSVEELTFSRAANGGYDLRWVTLSVAVEAPGAMQPLLEKVYGIGVGATLLLTVSADGAVEGVRNAADLRALTERMMTAVLAGFDSEFSAMPAADRATLNKMMAAMVDQQRQMSDEAFADSLLENPRMLFPGLGAMVPGQPRTAEAEAESPYGGQMRFLTEVELRRFEPGVAAEIRVSSVANPDDAKRAVEAFMAAMIASLPDPEQRRRAQAQIATLGPMVISDEAVMTLALPSGIAETVRYQKPVSVPGQPARVDTRRYDRAR